MFCKRKKNHNFKTFITSLSHCIQCCLYILSGTLKLLQVNMWTLSFHHTSNCITAQMDIMILIVRNRLACTNIPAFSHPTCCMQYDCNTFFYCLYCKWTSHIYCKNDACVSSYREKSTCGSVLWPLKFPVKRFMSHNNLKTKTFP